MTAINKKIAKAGNELALFRFTSATLRPWPRATTATNTVNFMVTPCINNTEPYFIIN